MARSRPPPPSKGMRILGMDPTQGPQICVIGVCPQEDTLDTELGIRDNLVVYGRYFGLSRSESARAPTSCCGSSPLSEKKAKVEDLSGGMKRRLTIARPR